MTSFHQCRLYSAFAGFFLSLTLFATTALAVIPKPPAALKATAILPTQITLGWTDASTDETAFEVERSLDGKTFVKLGETVANVVIYQSIGLTASTAYWYRVRAKNASGVSAYSNIATATTKPPLVTIPDAPAALTASAASGSRIDLKWTDAADDETAFELERSLNGTTFIKIADIRFNTVAYADTGLLPRTRYWYRILSKNTAGRSPYSNIASATTLDVVPDAPTGLQAVARSPYQINLGWRDNSDNETGFDIERSLDGKTFSRVGGTAANVAAFQNLGLTPATRYYYRVRAVNAVGASAYTNIVTLESQPIPVPNRPENFSAVPLAPAIVQLRWDAVTGGASEIIIERSQGTDERFEQIGKLAASVTSFQDKDSLDIDDYYYRVKAVNAGGSSPYSIISIVLASSIITGEEALPATSVYAADGRRLVVDLPGVQRAALSIFDLTGARRRAASIAGKADLDLAFLQKGIYIVVIETGKRVLSRKILVY